MIQGLTLCALLAAAPDPLDEALARPMSPGSLALLVEHGNDPRVIERWSAGLRDPRSEVRAAAARLARVRHSGALAEAVRAALPAERDHRAASELRAALIAVSPADVELVLADGQRRGALGSTLLQLAQARGAAALAAWPRVRAMEGGRANLAAFLVAAARSDPKALGVVAVQAIRERDAVAWAAVLEAQRRLGVPPDTGLSTAAVRAGGDMAEAAVVGLALSSQPPAELLVEALTEARPALEPRPPAAVALELLDRGAGKPHRDLRPLIEGLRTRPEGAWLHQREVAERLDPAERRTLHPDGPRDLPAIPPGTRTFDAETLPSLLRLASGYPPDFVADTLAAAGCAVKGAQPLGGRVAYRPDGTPATVTAFDDLGGGAGCLRATRALLASYVLPETARPVAPAAETLMLVADPGLLACSGEAPVVPGPSPAGSVPERVGGRIQEPKKVHSVPPRYPEAAKTRRSQGVVILEAQVTPAGCVADLRVLRGVDPQLDLAALVAVSQWRYTPTLLDGVPVPIVMTVTMNFKLN